MRIESVHIQNVNGIKDVHIPFNDGLNILCGTNGVGKSTVLYAVMGAFSSKNDKLSRSAISDIEGSVTVVSEGNACKYSVNNRRVEQNKLAPLTLEYNNGRSFNKKAREVCFFKPHRDIPEKNPDAIPRLLIEDAYYWTRLTDGVNAEGLKGWFQNKFLFAETKNDDSRLSGVALRNHESAVKCFGALDPETTFSHVESASHDIVINTRRGKVSLNSLSSGYQSALYVLLGLIQTIEKLSPNENELRCVNDFDGVILVDEIDAQLHPQWQAAFVSALKDLAPRAQMIVTTHSATVIQNAAPGEIIALEFDESGNVALKDLPDSKYGYKGWTLEEVFTDVMGMESTRSQEYIDAEKAFNAALLYDDIIALKRHYDELLKMLHPMSHVRKLLEIQMAGMR